MSAYPRFLHLMINVANLEASLAFYVGLLGMHELRRTEAPEEGRTAVFVGYGAETDATALELTYRKGAPPPKSGGPLVGHIAIGVSDARATCARLAAGHVRIDTEPFRIPNGKTIAFVSDPDGHAIELVEPPSV